jgi:hypothetical protein
VAKPHGQLMICQGMVGGGGHGAISGARKR